jgi:hypothetical protein
VYAFLFIDRLFKIQRLIMKEYQVRFIENNLQLSNRLIAQRLDLTEAQVRCFLSKRGIRRTQEQLEQIRERIGANRRGENNPNWRGGRSTNNYFYKKRQMERYPERVRARVRVYQAKKKGELIPQPCFICGNSEVEAHHPNYSKPLEVLWLCPEHHREIENEGSLFSGKI